MNYRIGSFNLKNFGAYADFDTANSQRRDFDKIAQIIHEEDLDIVAFQEILGEGKGLKRLLEQYVQSPWRPWDFCWASPRESSDPTKCGKDLRGEGYAYIWNKRKFKKSASQSILADENERFEPRILNSLSNDVNTDCSIFARTPYYLRLEPCYGGFFELRFLNVHIYYGSALLSDVQKRKVEYDLLVQEIYPRIAQQRYGNFRPAYTIALGDYNLNMRLFSPGRRDCLTEAYSQANYQVRTIQEQLSTLRKTTGPQTGPRRSAPLINKNEQLANNYDHFSYSPELSPFEVVSCRTIDAVSKYCGGDYSYYYNHISDHLPVLLEIEI